MSGCFYNTGNDARMERRLNAHLEASSNDGCPCGGEIGDDGKCVECGWKPIDRAYAAELKYL